MKQNYSLSVNDAARILGLRHDVVLRYLREGRIKGKLERGRGRFGEWKLPRSIEIQEPSFSIEQAAEKLGKHPDTVRRLVRTGKPPGEKIGSKHGGEWRVFAVAIPVPLSASTNRALQRIRRSSVTLKGATTQEIREMIRRGFFRKRLPLPTEVRRVEAIATAVLREDKRTQLDQELHEAAYSLLTAIERFGIMREVPEPVFSKGFADPSKPNRRIIRYILNVGRPRVEYDCSRILHFLRSGPKTIAQLAKATHRAPRTIHDRLRRLCAGGQVSECYGDHSGEVSYALAGACDRELAASGPPDPALPDPADEVRDPTGDELIGAMSRELGEDYREFANLD